MQEEVSEERVIRMDERGWCGHSEVHMREVTTEVETSYSAWSETDIADASTCADVTPSEISKPVPT